MLEIVKLTEEELQVFRNGCLICNIQAPLDTWFISRVYTTFVYFSSDELRQLASVLDRLNNIL